MLSVKVKVKKKHNFKKGLVSGTDSGTEEVLQTLTEVAKAYAPVDTGHLKSNIYSSMKRRIGYLISKARYSIFQEYGTSKMSAANGGQGYLRPAVDYIKTKVVGIYGKNVRAKIRRN